MYENLLKLIRERKGDIEQKILGGQLEDFSSYRFNIGILKGMEETINIIKSSNRGEKDE